jgi:large subunit ribosomal protein L9
MEIILKQDIKNLGYKDDLVVVKNGHARNFLIPQGMAVQASDSTKKVRAENVRQQAFKEEKLKGEAETLAKALETISVKINVKASSTGKIFGSVNNIQVASAIKEQFNYDIDRKKIDIDGSAIKEVGNYSATINLFKEVKVEVKLDVAAEEE